MAYNSLRFKHFPKNVQDRYIARELEYQRLLSESRARGRRARAAEHKLSSSHAPSTNPRTRP